MFGRVQCLRARSTRVVAGLLAVGLLAVPSVAQAPTNVTSSAAMNVGAVLEWDRENADALVDVLGRASREGLDPSLYGVEALKLALRNNDRESINYLATAAALQIASDYRYGRVPQSARVDWHMGQAPNPAALMPLVQAALGSHRIKQAIEGLLPQNDEYKALRAALEAGDADADAIRVNMERWRWMPRSLGQDHLFVNVPSHQVQIVRGGTVVAFHDAIVGKPDTPTPAISSEVRAVALNPTWSVPPLLKEKKLAFYKKNPAAARRMGFSVSYANGDVRITQAPGPQNALGQVKLVMPNQWAIFLHDTSERKLFEGSRRTLSSGCVRVDRPLEMVNELLDGSEWDSTRVDEALASGRQTNASLPAPIPVYITYITATIGEDGRVTTLPDPYKRDAAVAAALKAKPSAGSRLQVALN